MQQNTTVTLQTERLILRDFQKEDWQVVHEYGSDPEVVKYMPFGPNTEEETKAFIQKTLAKQKEQPRLSFNFALVNKQDNKLIGACEIRIKSVENKEGEIGYILNHRYWNQGYMTEAAHAVMAFGFEKFGLHRIIATCDPANSGSYRVMEKLGMQREGCLREAKLFKGVWRDFLLYSILEKEWRNLQTPSTEKVDEENDGGKEIEYLEKNQNDLDLIRPLWEKLNAHHITVSRYFKDNRAGTTFDMRKNQLLEKSYQGALRIDLARDAVTKEYIGYCVTSVNPEKQGEIESIYVEKDYRLSGIGDSLMARALGWSETVTVKKTILGVAEGNEGVFAFYQRHNFYPRVTVLWHSPEIGAEVER
jgi:RimJ/RimL family protein N-acetyltransferase/GNAT superfamily N-acetyltransferase